MGLPNFKWHRDVISDTAWDVLKELQSLTTLSSFYLAGGTALALQLGHRTSYDLDFFNNKLFSEDLLLQKIQTLEDIEVISREEHTLHLTIKGVKVSFLGYAYPLLHSLQNIEIDEISTIQVADMRDIGCMKISAISSRGSKRDFIDLYMVAQLVSLPELLNLYKKKFSVTPHNNVHIYKSLLYFEDAEDEPMPNMNISLKWKTVKNYFDNEVPKLMK